MYVTYSSVELHGRVSLASCALPLSTSLNYERECEGYRNLLLRHLHRCKAAHSLQDTICSFPSLKTGEVRVKSSYFRHSGAARSEQRCVKKPTAHE
jgi:hypothetical protein